MVAVRLSPCNRQQYRLVAHLRSTGQWLRNRPITHRIRAQCRHRLTHRCQAFVGESLRLFQRIQRSRLISRHDYFCHLDLHIDHSQIMTEIIVNLACQPVALSTIANSFACTANAANWRLASSSCKGQRFSRQLLLLCPLQEFNQPDDKNNGRAEHDGLV